MARLRGFLLDTWERVTGRYATRTNRYGEWYVEKAYVAAEIELIIGLVTAATILIYGGSPWVALGTLVGFLILEFFMLMAISIAENVIVLRKQMAALLVASKEWGPAAVPPVPISAADIDQDRFKVARILMIAAIVTLTIVLVRALV